MIKVENENLVHCGECEDKGFYIVYNAYDEDYREPHFCKYCFTGRSLAVEFDYSTEELRNEC